MAELWPADFIDSETVVFDLNRDGPPAKEKVQTFDFVAETDFYQTDENETNTQVPVADSMQTEGEGTQGVQQAPVRLQKHFAASLKSFGVRVILNCATSFPRLRFVCHLMFSTLCSCRVLIVKSGTGAERPQLAPFSRRHSVDDGRCTRRKGRESRVRRLHLRCAG